MIALLLLLDRFAVQPPLLRLLTDPLTINTAGRQRMLSQRISKSALALALPDLPGRDRYRTELRGLLNVWSATHEDLSLRLDSPAVHQAFQAIEPVFVRMKNAARRCVDSEVPSTKTLSELLDAEEAYLDRMEQIVGMLEQGARARVDGLIWTGWIVAALIAVALIVIQVTLFEPATRLIEHQIRALQASRDVLEQRVRERTGEWKAANLALHQEAKERRLADERNRSLLEQFSHVSRTNTIGELASGLAHELNQPLGSIANYAEGCLVALGAPDPDLREVRGAIEKLLASTLRAGRIIHRVRRFVTRQAPIREPFDANDAIREVAELLADEFARRGLTLQTRLAPDLPCLIGDPVQIQQVLVNLARNAIDAVGATQLATPSIVMETRPGGLNTLEVHVSDNGEGIVGEKLNHVFDPFFSTRAEGMGMGLSICRTIIEAHQGAISVESEPAVRTTFRLTLPTIGDDADAETDRLPR